jgi:tryptophan synthase beta chain
MKYRTNNLDDGYYLLWSALGPHPYPTIVGHSQSIVGRETKKQFKELSWKELPDIVCACVGWWSNAIGIFSWFVGDKSVELVWVEAAGQWLSSLWEHAARIAGQQGTIGVIQWYKSYFLQDEAWNMQETSSISAWLDYAGIWPEHAHLHVLGRATYVAATDDEVMDAFNLLAQQEWILWALESAHAVAYAIKHAPTMSTDQTIVINLSWRGDKDLHTIIAHQK